MLDERSDELLKLCNDILLLDPAAVTVASAGFVTVKSATEGEFTLDVGITRSTCFLIRQMHQQRLQQASKAEAEEKEKVTQKVSPRRPTPTAAVLRNSPPSGRAGAGTEQRRPPVPHASTTPVMQTPRNNNNYFSSSAPQPVQTFNSAQSRISTASQQRMPTPLSASSASVTSQRSVPPPASAASRSSRSSTTSKFRSPASASDDSVLASAESLLMLRRAPAGGEFTPQQGIASSAKRSASAPRSGGSSGSGTKSGSAGRKQSPPTAASIYTASASCDIRNFVRAHSDLPQGYAPVCDDFHTFAASSTCAGASSSESFVEAFAPAQSFRSVTEESIQAHNQYHQQVLQDQHTHRTHHFAVAESQQQQVAHVTQTTHSLVEKKVGVYFRKESINFGAVAIGSLTRANIELCNATDEQVTVYLGDPMLPYVLLHNEISLRPRAYVRVPLRFLPVEEGEYCNELIAQTADGNYHTRIHLAGSAYA